MLNMPRQKKILMITLLCIAFVQMPHLALNPAIAVIKESVFPNRSLSEIQTALSLPNLISMAAAVISALLIGKSIISKKAAVIAGLVCVTMTGVFALLMHTQFWHIIILSVVMGAGIGMYIPSTMSTLFDNYTEGERQIITGYQTSFINLGGILMSALGGYLASLMWYGGYLAMFFTLPVAMLALFTIPKVKKEHKASGGTSAAVKSKLPLDVFYYGAFILIFMLIYNVLGANISSHIQAANIGDSRTAGIAMAVQMAGGVASGLVFSKLSAKLRDYVIFLAFLSIFIGYTILNIGHSSLLLVYIGVFVTGMSLSLIIPQCLFSVSNIVDPTNSSTATSIVSCLAPGTGGFLSPVVFTNLTSLIGGDSTNFRFQFVGAVSLAVGIIFVLDTIRREKRRQQEEPLYASN
jgi:MFS family permease